MKVDRQRKSVLGRLGFSLVEVVIAMSIASLAITVLLGLVPAGMGALKEAGATHVKTNAFRHMLNEVQTADWGVAAGGGSGWTGLSPFNGAKRYFDDQGSLIPSSDAEAIRTRLAFVARFEFPSLSVPLPGVAPGAAGFASDMILLKMDFAQSPNPTFDFGDPNLFDTRTMIVTRLR